MDGNGPQRCLGLFLDFGRFRSITAILWTSLTASITSSKAHRREQRPAWCGGPIVTGSSHTISTSMRDSVVSRTDPGMTRACVDACLNAGKDSNRRSDFEFDPARIHNVAIPALHGR